MKTIHSALMTFVTCTAAVLACGTASARTIPAAAGMPTSLNSAGQSVDDFAWLTTGIIAPNATASSARIWVIALPIDTAGGHSFIVKGTPSSGLSCLLESRGAVQQSIAIPVSSVGTNPAPTNMSVQPGDTVVVRCTFTSSNGRVLLVDYNP